MLNIVISTNNWLIEGEFSIPSGPKERQISKESYRRTQIKVGLFTTIEVSKKKFQELYSPKTNYFDLPSFKKKNGIESLIARMSFDYCQQTKQHNYQYNKKHNHWPYAQFF